MRHAARTDKTQNAIVAALRKAGASVWVIGLPVDLIAGVRGETHLIECKSSAKRYLAPLTPLQADFIASWRGRMPHVVSTPDEALRAVGLVA